MNQNLTSRVGRTPLRTTQHKNTHSSAFTLATKAVANTVKNFIAISSALFVLCVEADKRSWFGCWLLAVFLYVGGERRDAWQIAPANLDINSYVRSYWVKVVLLSSEEHDVSWTCLCGRHGFSTLERYVNTQIFGKKQQPWFHKSEQTKSMKKWLAWRR